MDKEKTVSSGEKVVLFVQKYRIAIFILLALLTAGVAASLSFFSIRNHLQKKAIVVLEEFEKRRELLGDVESAPPLETEALLAETNAFAASTFGYAAARAFSMSADIYAARNEWALAEETWNKSAQKGAKTFLAPLSLFNAAVAAEEQGKLEDAIDYYKRSLDYTGLFAAASRARFNIGRIYEAMQNKAAAIEAYRFVIEKGSADSSWSKLAQSRIISLELE